jgi:peptide/nickel transport system substrate-binding protein
MTLRDRGLIAALSFALIGLTIASLAPSLEGTREVGAQPSTLPVARPYTEGVLGHATNASPFGARSPADRDLVALLFRGLVRLGPGNAIVPDLASRWEVDPAGAAWTFHLRPGLAWQDGQPLTADDVAFTVQTLSDASYDGPGAASWRDVTATAVDPLTVTLQLATPLGGFLVAATQPIAPAHLLAAIAPADLPNDPFGRHPIGSGPFRLTSLNASGAVLEPATGPDVLPGDGGGPTFRTPPPTDSLGSSPPTTPPRDPMPYLSGMEFLYYDDVASLRAAWDDGLLDAASGLPPTDAMALGSGPGARIVRYPGSTLLAVELNLRPAHAEFRDPAVRRALLAAIDRDAIVAEVLDGLGKRADSLIPPSSDFFDASASKPIASGAATARAALIAAGWKQSGTSWIPKGAKKPLLIEVLSPDSSANPIAFEIATDVVASWRAIGLDARAVAMPVTLSLADRLRTGVFQAAVLPLVIGLDPDLYPLLASSQTRTGGANVSGLQDQALDKLLTAARAPTPKAGRPAAYSALQKALNAGTFILPIAFRDEVVVLRGTVTGPVARPVATSGDRFWDVLTWRLAVGR